MVDNSIRKIIRFLFLKLGLDDYVHYINGPETLPEPLSADEEKELLSKLNENRDEVRDELIIHNLRLVVYIAKKFETPLATVEDLVSIGTIGLIKAVNTFNTDKNIKLATYASRCIENEILMYLRKCSTQKSEISIDEPINIDYDGNELLFSDILGSDGEEIGREMEKEDEKKMLNSLLHNLNNREQQIMKLRFGIGGMKEHTQKEVADTLGISQSYISRIEKRTIKKLKRQIEKTVQI